MFFDRLRKGALSFFGQEDSPDPEPSLEARQLKELVFRENADLLYAREQPPATIDQSIFDMIFPEVDIDHLSLDNNAGFLEFFNFPETSSFDGNFPEFDLAATDNQFEQPTLPELPLDSQSASSTTSRQLAKIQIDEAQLRTAIQRLPVCSHCKRRRIKCDMNLPACRNCAKLGRDCRHWDSALAEETSRKYVTTLPENRNTDRD